MKSFIKLSVSISCGLLITACSDNENIIAKIDKTEITQEAFTAFLQLKRVPQQDEKLVAQYLDQYLEREALATSISKQDFLNDALTQAEINEYVKQLKISRYFDEYLKDRVSEEAIRNYYTVNAEHYSKRKAHIAHILIRTNSSATEVERQAQLSRAHEAYTKVMMGENFSEVVKVFSEDKRSAAKDGDLGWLVEGAVDAVFSKKAFTMGVNEVSEPFATSFGFHVIKVLEAPQIIQTPYEKVKGDIRYELRQAAKQAETERLLGQVKLTRNSKED